MIKLAFALTALFAFYTLTARAEQPTMASYALPNAHPEELKTVAEIFGLEHKRGDTYEVQIPASQANLLLALAPGARLLEPDVAKADRARRARLQAENGYHSFEQVQSWMHAKKTSLFTLQDYGKSREGYPLTVLHLASPKSAGRPAVMITAATHGDELITTEVLMDLVDKLEAGYGADDRLTKIVDSHDLYFVPVVNPDGFTNAERFDGNQDPNRSYPWPGHENVTPTPSIAAIMQLFQRLDLKATIDFHAYGELIMFPWAYTHDPIAPAAHQRFDALTKQMAETNHYTQGPIADVIYVAPGSSADYYFWKKGSLSLGIEMGQEKIPDPSEFPAYFQSQEESTWRFLEGV